MRALLSWTCCLLVLLSASCGRERDDGREVVRFWAMGSEGELVAQLLPEFERLNPGIHVDLQQQPWTAAHEKLLTAFAGDALPDVCSLGNTWVPEFAALGALDPFSSCPDFWPSSQIWGESAGEGRWDRIAPSGVAARRWPVARDRPNSNIL